MPPSLWRQLAALLWIVAANALAVWWISGDIEMGWILAMILVPAAGVVIGGVAAAILGGPLRAHLPLARGLPALAISPVLGTLFLIIAMRSAPLSLPLEPTPDLRAAADSLAADRAALQAEARRITGTPVEIGEPSVVISPGRLVKEGFRLALTRVEPTATVSFTFAAGPRRRMVFDVVRDDGIWRARPRDPERFTESTEIELTRAYLDRRFPGREATLDADWPDYTRGDTVLVFLRRAISDAAHPLVTVAAPPVAAGAASAVVRDAPPPDDEDWEFIVFRLGEGEEMLREVRRYSRDEIVAHFTRAADDAGLGRLRSLRFVRPPNRLQDPSFGFLGELDGGPRRVVWFAAIRSGDEVEFTVATPGRLTR